MCADIMFFEGIYNGFLFMHVRAVENGYAVAGSFIDVMAANVGDEAASHDYSEGVGVAFVHDAHFINKDHFFFTCPLFSDCSERYVFFL